MYQNVLFHSFGVWNAFLVQMLLGDHVSLRSTFGSVKVFIEAVGSLRNPMIYCQVHKNLRSVFNGLHVVLFKNFVVEFATLNSL